MTIETPAHERLERRQYLTDLSEIASLASGKRFLFKFFRDNNAMQYIYAKKAEGHRLAGRQEMAMEIWNDLHEANQEASIELFRKIMTQTEDEKND